MRPRRTRGAETDLRGRLSADQAHPPPGPAFHPPAVPVRDAAQRLLGNVYRVAGDPRRPAFRPWRRAGPGCGEGDRGPSPQTRHCGHGRDSPVPGAARDGDPGGVSGQRAGDPQRAHRFAQLRRAKLTTRRGRRATDLVTLLLKKRLFSSPAATHSAPQAANQSCWCARSLTEWRRCPCGQRTTVQRSRPSPAASADHRAGMGFEDARLGRAGPPALVSIPVGTTRRVLRLRPKPAAAIRAPSTTSPSSPCWRPSPKARPSSTSTPHAPP